MPDVALQPRNLGQGLCGKKRAWEDMLGSYVGFTRVEGLGLMWILKSLLFFGLLYSDCLVSILKKVRYSG